MELQADALRRTTSPLANKDKMTRMCSRVVNWRELLCPTSLAYVFPIISTFAERKVTYGVLTRTNVLHLLLSRCRNVRHTMNVT